MTCTGYCSERGNDHGRKERPVSSSRARRNSHLEGGKTYKAKFETSKGDFEAELYSDTAPMSVNNFVFLANEGFYDGVIFHRIIRGFVVQGGDPTGTGTRRPRLQVRR